MIFANSFEKVKDSRFEGKLFNGSMYARTNYLGADTSHRDTPQALLVEQSARSEIPAHFHGIDQYQVVVKGGGHLGKHAVGPICVHYAAAYTGYGPLNADQDGLFYFTLRAQSEPGAFFFPEGRKHQKAAKRRNLTKDLKIDYQQEQSLEIIFPHEEEGLGAWSLRLDPGEKFEGPDPLLGGGQYYLVLDGGLDHGGSNYSKWSCIFVEPPEKSVEISAGSEGLWALILQFPFWEKGTELSKDAPLYAEDRIA
ncbi:MAG: hypothetical protein CMM58_05690 [Rhodospirillaceae bacterium]|nr:hypothetical protein [Rhodospirillaceae bacterium]|tara:strand:+ start:1277 stop:2035 length:759 start_codon:yes stop_codon:yes gene_type:complete